jgi:hypothetical protein
MGNQPPPSAARLKQGNPICRPTQYRTRAAKNDSASAYRFYRNAKKLQARRSNPALLCGRMDCFAALAMTV